MRVAAGVIIAIIVALAGAPRPAAADSSTAQYTVAPHDTMYSIARRFGVSVAALAGVNGLRDPSRLRAGTVLIIPAATSTITRTAAVRIAPVREPVPPSRGVSAPGLPAAAAGPAHVVQPGDTLYHLAVTHGLTVAALEAENHLSSDHITAGQVLRMPGDQSSTRGTPGPAGMPDSAPIPPLNRSSLGVPSWPHPVRPYQAEIGRRVGAAALRYLGTPYVWGGTSARGVDCSGLVYLVYSPYLPHMARSSYDQWQMGDAVDRSDLASGDLVFFDTDGSGASHVGIYIGDGQFVHPASSANRVVIDRLDQPYYVTHYIGARRVL